MWQVCQIAGARNWKLGQAVGFFNCYQCFCIYQWGHLKDKIALKKLKHVVVVSTQNFQPERIVERRRIGEGCDEVQFHNIHFLFWCLFFARHFVKTKWTNFQSNLAQSTKQQYLNARPLLGYDDDVSHDDDHGIFLIKKCQPWKQVSYTSYKSLIGSIFTVYKNRLDSSHVPKYVQSKDRRQKCRLFLTYIKKDASTSQNYTM